MPDNYLVPNKQQLRAIQCAIDTFGSADQPSNFIRPFDLNHIQTDDVSLRAIRSAMYGLGLIPAISNEPHDPDNANGKMLIAAVKEFQRQHDITPDGVVGNNTLTELRPTLAIYSHEVTPDEELPPPLPWWSYKTADITKDKTRV
ncbi:MAG: peptidoglycan-binding domain-containing protein [Rickettsiales bacterium]